MGVKKHHPERKLLVEGKTDLYFIAELWKKQIGIDAARYFSIIDCGGKEQLVQNIADFGNDRNNIWKATPTTHLGIVIDADESAANTLQSVADALNRAGFAGFPKVLNSQGLICEINSIQIGVWIMPNNAAPGMAEDMFLTFFPEKLNAQRGFAEQTLNRLENDKLHLYDIDLQRSKALTHTLLAWQDEPGLAMGTAVLRNCVTLPTEKQPFIDWLGRLFS